MRFLHAADTHLGYRQYNLEERLKDFEKAFENVAKAAVGEHDAADGPADFLLIAGDLFDDRSINARTYTHASAVLSRLRDRGIPVYVIEGNHDRAFHGDGMSWLDALAHEDLINLVRLREDEDGGLEYLADHRELEVDGELTRIYGVKYVGSSTPKVAKAVAEEVKRIESEDPADVAVAMMHFGIEGEGDGPGYSYNCLLPLKEHVDYIALGHYHNAYEVEDWVYNPGSVEPTSVSEADEDRGVYLYDDGDVGLLDLGGREFDRVFVDVSEAETPEEAYGLVRDRATDEDGAVVDVVLNGELRFDRSILSRDGLEEVLESEPLHLMLKVNATRDELDVDTGDVESREQIERRVFDKVAEDASLPDGAASAMSEVKELALAGAPDEDVLDAVAGLVHGEDVEELNEGRAPEEESDSVPGKEPDPPESGDPDAEEPGGESEWDWRRAVAD